MIGIARPYKGQERPSHLIGQFPVSFIKGRAFGNIVIEVDLFTRMPTAQIAVVTVKEVLIDRNTIFQGQAVETIMRVGKVDTAIDLRPIPVCFLIAFRIIDF